MNTAAVSPAPAIFAHDPRTPAGLRAIAPRDRSHPSRFTFADDESARNYVRELKNQPFPDGTLPITMVTGTNTQSRSALIGGLIRLRHAETQPKLLLAFSENSMRRLLGIVDRDAAPYVWLLGDKHCSHALAIFAACHPFTRIYLMSPLPGKPLMSASLQRMSRIIRLAA